MLDSFHFRLNLFALPVSLQFFKVSLPIAVQVFVRIKFVFLTNLKFDTQININRVVDTAFILKLTTVIIFLSHFYIYHTVNLLELPDIIIIDRSFVSFKYIWCVTLNRNILHYFTALNHTIVRGRFDLIAAAGEGANTQLILATR